MEQTQHNAAKYAFFYMLSLVALVFMALSTGMIIFQIINKYITDVLEQYSAQFSSQQLKFAISALLISSPIFYVTTRQIYKSLFSGALNKDSGVRKWLTYFILLVAAIVVIGWLIGIVNSFLDGELTLKFILKALTAIAIAVIIFTFYLYDIRREEIAGKQDKVIRMYFFGSLAIVIIVFVIALLIVESPAETRKRKLDNAIINNFSQIDSAMSNYYYDYQKLPENLDNLVADSDFLTEEYILDPVTKEKFDYNIKDNNTYELCANFQTSNKEDRDDYNYYNKAWLHDAGYQCLSQKVRLKDVVEPERIPVPVLD